MIEKRASVTGVALATGRSQRTAERAKTADDSSATPHPLRRLPPDTPCLAKTGGLDMNRARRP